MNINRGEVWLAKLDPTQGSEQAGIRPVIIFQDNTISQFTTTVISIPLTTNLRRAQLPTCIKISSDEGGLNKESVALCHQIRVLSKTRLIKKLGQLEDNTIRAVETILLFTLGCSISSQ